MVSVVADSPAEFDAVLLVHDAAAAGLLLAAAVHIPFSGVGKGTAPVVHLVQDLQVGYLDVAEVLPVQVPFGDLVAGIDVPHFMDTGNARGIERHRNIQVMDLLSISKSGKGRDPCRNQDKQTSHPQILREGISVFFSSVLR